MLADGCGSNHTAAGACDSTLARLPLLHARPFRPESLVRLASRGRATTRRAGRKDPHSAPPAAAPSDHLTRAAAPTSARPPNLSRHERLAGHELGLRPHDGRRRGGVGACRGGRGQAHLAPVGGVGHGERSPRSTLGAASPLHTSLGSPRPREPLCRRPCPRRHDCPLS